MLPLILRNEHSQNLTSILTPTNVAMHREKKKEMFFRFFNDIKNLHHLSTIAVQFLAMSKEVVMVLTLDLVQIEIFVYLFIPRNRA